MNFYGKNVFLKKNDSWGLSARRIISLLLLFAMVLGVFPANAFAQGSEIDTRGFDDHYTSDWELPAGAEIHDSNVLNLGLSFEDVQDEGGKAVVYGSIIYRALATPQPSSMWLYFRLDPKLAPYLPTYFDVKCNAMYGRYAQLVSADMVDGPKAWFDNFGCLGEGRNF